MSVLSWLTVIVSALLSALLRIVSESIRAMSSAGCPCHTVSVIALYCLVAVVTSGNRPRQVVVVTVSVQLSVGEIPCGKATKRSAAAAESGSVALLQEVVALLERERTCPSAAIAPWKCGLLLLPAVGVGIRSGIVTATESTEPVSWKAGPSALGGVVGVIDTV
jgi:hypothetical protein